ncbi:Fatty acyl-CoA reductase 1 [Nymphon striatum]|nr:Fatty acyl-CoA reductase 1 [Nymphon striatum]
MIEDLNSTFPSIAEFYSGRNILITGGTGFMGKVLIEKLLKSCPNLSKIYILIRNKNKTSINDRFPKFLAGKVFDRIRNRNPTDLEKIVPIPADLLSPDLGISEDDLQMLKNNVSIIFHSAATIKFEEHLKQSIQLNAGGTYKLLQIAQDMPKLVAFIHVSTAYSNCDRTQIDEKIYPMDVDPLKLMETVEWMDDKMVETITPAMLGKKPNTYTFTKAMAETIIEQHRKHVPVVIVRPSIVTCSWKDPVPYSKGVFRTACVDLEAVTDIIPVDICVNLFIAAAWHCANTMPNEVVVYNSTSGSVNPFHWKDFHQLREIVNQYPSDSFYRCPGGTLRTTEITFLITKYYDHYIPAFFADLFSTITRIPLFPHGYEHLFSFLPQSLIIRLAVSLSYLDVRTICILLRRRWTALGTYRRLEKSMKSLNYFTRHEWHFENKNSEQILKSMNLEDSQKFIVSAKFINWVEYMNTYYLGVKKFILNEDIKNLPRARRNLKMLRARFRPLSPMRKKLSIGKIQLGEEPANPQPTLLTLFGATQVLEFWSELWLRSYNQASKLVLNWVNVRHLLRVQMPINTLWRSEDRVQPLRHLHEKLDDLGYLNAIDNFIIFSLIIISPLPTAVEFRRISTQSKKNGDTTTNYSLNNIKHFKIITYRYAMGCAFQAALFVCTWSLLANFSTSFNDLTTCILETFYAMIAVLSDSRYSLDERVSPLLEKSSILSADPRAQKCPIVPLFSQNVCNSTEGTFDQVCGRK